MMFDERRAQLQQQKAALVAYARMKLEAGDDLHAVADAAMDIRELDARLDELQRIERGACAGTAAPSVRSSVCEVASGSFRCALPVGHDGPHRNSDEWTMPNPRQPLA